MTKCDVFISWAGKRSQAEATALKLLLNNMLPDVSVFMSDQDIPIGALWVQTIYDTMRLAKYTVAVLTPENLTRPWINFESGMAFASPRQRKGVGVILEGGLNRHSLAPFPFASFQGAVSTTRTDMDKLILSIAAQVKHPSLDRISDEDWNTYCNERESALTSASEALEDQDLPPFLSSLYCVIFDQNASVDSVDSKQVLPPLLRFRSKTFLDEVNTLSSHHRWHALARIRDRFWRPLELSGAYQDAIEVAKQCREAARMIEDPHTEYKILIRDIVWLSVLNREFDKAEEKLQEVKTSEVLEELSAELRYYWYRYRGVVYMSQDESARKSLEDAEWCFNEAERLIPDTDSRIRTDLKARIIQNKGRLAEKRNQLPEAIRCYRFALSHFKDLKDDEHIAIASDKLALAIIEQCEKAKEHSLERTGLENTLEEAENLLNSALLHATLAGWTEGIARIHLHLGHWRRMQNDIDGAYVAFENSWRVYRSLNLRHEAAEAAKARDSLEATKARDSLEATKARDSL